MESKRKNKSGGKDTLAQMETIANNAKGSRFTDEFRNAICKETHTVSETFNCNQIQATLFSVIFNLNFTRSSVDIEDISNYLDCTPITIVRHMNELEGLCGLKVLCRLYTGSKQNRSQSNMLDSLSYFVNRKVLDVLLRGEKYTPGSTAADDSFDLIRKVAILFNQHDKANLSYKELEQEIESLLSENERLDFVRQLKRYNLHFYDELILLYLFNHFLDGEESVDFSQMTGTVFPDFRIQLEIRRAFLDGSNKLLLEDLVELEDGFFRSDRVLRLSERGFDLLIGVDKKLFRKSTDKKFMDLIMADEIRDKALFYNAREKQQLHFLKETLNQDKYTELVDRLNHEGMKTGFTVLFHGVPGVGKTESVFQIARETGRDIKMVTISETKSMWYGQSEKLIKEVFDQYRKQVEKSEVTPILLFNEADGVFSSRKQIGHSNVDQTENAIQNIILQEMEDLEGILIATTNLLQNLDKAFDRRFLYKIRFDKPDFKNRIRIWKDRIEGLSISVLKTLAEKYEFTGGQIDNIARKFLMQKVLYGSTDLTKIEKFCEEEMLEGTTHNKIGFR